MPSWLTRPRLPRGLTSVPYVTLLWEGKNPTRWQPRAVPTEDCIGRLGLRKHHDCGAEPEDSLLEPASGRFSGSTGYSSPLTGGQRPDGWPTGWYLIPVSDLPPAKARKILERYPTRDWSDY